MDELDLSDHLHQLTLPQIAIRVFFACAVTALVLVGSFVALSWLFGMG